MFIDGIVIFTYDEIENIKDEVYKTKLKYIISGMELIIGTKKSFKEKGLILFRKQLREPGNYKSGFIFQVVTIYFNLTESKENIDQFKLLFKERYLTEIVRETNYFKLQQYQNDQRIKLQYWNEGDVSNANNPIVKTYFTIITDAGLVLNIDNTTKVESASESFRYTQLLSCRAEDPQTAKNKMGEELAQTYQSNDACLVYIVSWSSQPNYNLLCSIYKTETQFKVQKQILAATIFADCFEEGMSEIVNLLKNNGMSLENVQINNFRIQRYVGILDDIIKFDYDRFKKDSSQFYKDFIFLKTGAKRWIAQLLKMINDAKRKNNANELGNSNSTNSTGSNLNSEKSSSQSEAEKQSTSSSSQSDNTYENKKGEVSQKIKDQISKYDIDDYEELSAAQKIQQSSFGISESISNKLAEYNKNYIGSSSYSSSKSNLSTQSVSTGSVVEKSSKSKSEIIEKILTEFQSSSQSMQMTKNEVEKVSNFVKKNVAFINFMDSHHLKITQSVIQDIIKMSQQDIWRKYEELVKDPDFNFIYEKKTQNNATKKFNSLQINKNTKNWAKEIKQKSVSKVLNIQKAYGPGSYKDLHEFQKVKPKCKINGKNENSENSEEKFVEPPIIPAMNSGNLVITVPSKNDIKSQRPELIDEEPETFNETPPMDESESLNLGPKTEKPVNNNPLNPKCTACIKECPDVYPACLKCPNPDNPKDPACINCTPDNPKYPNCRDELKNNIPSCPNGEMSCCIKGRPNYPECLCEDPRSKNECCAKFPNKEICKFKPKEDPKSSNPYYKPENKNSDNPDLSPDQLNNEVSDPNQNFNGGLGNSNGANGGGANENKVNGNGTNEGGASGVGSNGSGANGNLSNGNGSNGGGSNGSGSNGESGGMGQSNGGGGPSGGGSDAGGPNGGASGGGPSGGGSNGEGANGGTNGGGSSGGGSNGSPSGGANGGGPSGGGSNEGPSGGANGGGPTGGGSNGEGPSGGANGGGGGPSGGGSNGTGTGKGMANNEAVNGESDKGSNGESISGPKPDSNPNPGPNTNSKGQESGSKPPSIDPELNSEVIDTNCTEPSCAKNPLIGNDPTLNMPKEENKQSSPCLQPPCSGPKKDEEPVQEPPSIEPENLKEEVDEPQEEIDLPRKKEDQMEISILTTSSIDIDLDGTSIEGKHKVIRISDEAQNRIRQALINSNKSKEPDFKAKLMADGVNKRRRRF